MQHLFNNQALRDTHFRAEAPGDTFSDADKAAYLKASEDVLHGVDHSSDTGPGMPSKVVKYHRVAAQDWILGVDHQLQTMIGRGLSAFEPRMIDVVPVEKRFHLAACLDKGSDGFCGIWFLLFKLLLRMSPFFDPMHIPYRDLDSWMADTGIKPSMMLKSIHHNFTYGPYDGESWFCQLKELAKELRAMMLPDDPALLFVWPKICKEIGIDYETSTVADRKAFIKGLPEQEHMQNNGQRVCGCRWGTYAKAEQWRSGFEGQRCYLLLAQGILQGWAQNKKAKELMSQGIQPTPQSNSGGKSTKAAKQSISKVRDRSTNSAQLCLFILLDAKIQRDNATLIYVASRVDKAHSTLCRDLKSAAQVRDFYIWSALTKSYYLKTVWSLLFAFDDFDSLRKVGFDVDFHTATLQHMDKDGDDLASEAALASQFWTRNLSAIGRLIRGHLAGEAGRRRISGLSNCSEHVDAS